jgi:hypothetical protein
MKKRISLSYKNIAGDKKFTQIGIFAGMLYPVFQVLVTTEVLPSTKYISAVIMITGLFAGRKVEIKK